LGVSSLQQQLYGEAEVPLREAVRLNPNDPLTHLDLGHAFLNGDKHSQAIIEFEKVITLQRRSPWWFLPLISI
jgi:Flp pilus assembly protein TadD